MNRRSRFLITFLSAAATFGALYAFAGEARWNSHGWRGHHQHPHDWHRHCGAPDERTPSTAQPETPEPASVR